MTGAPCVRGTNEEIGESIHSKYRDILSAFPRQGKGEVDGRLVVRD